MLDFVDLEALVSDSEVLPPKLLCRKPYRKGVLVHPCGKCLACRRQARSQWTLRGELELMFAGGVGLFVTLSYADEFLPGGGNLSRRDVQLYVKRLRSSVFKAGGVSFRVSGSAEYGSRTGRAHYHLLVYGLGPEWESAVRSAWCDPKSGRALGWVDVKLMCQKSIGYVFGYVEKKLARSRKEREAGRVPEFSILPRRPGLGVPAVPALASVYADAVGQAELARRGDVSREFRVGSRRRFLSRFMLEKLREAAGVDADAAREASAGRYLAACIKGEREFGRATWRHSLPHSDSQRIRQVEARSRIFASRETF